MTMNLNLISKTAAGITFAVLSMMPLSVFGADTETINAQVTRQKEVDNGGSGRYKAIIVSEKTLPNFTVYRPRNVKYAARRGTAPHSDMVQRCMFGFVYRL